MRFLFQWLRPPRPSGTALHPTRTVDVDEPFAQVFEGSVHGVEQVLGGVVRDADGERGTIEATFGLIGSERVTITLQDMGERRTRVTVESRRGAAVGASQHSQYVDALIAYLQK